MADQTQNLQDLVSRAAAHDEAAFGQIYDLFFDKVYRFVYWRVSHQETAEDLTAEVFIRVWKKLSEVTDAGAFRSWVFQIARNLVIDYYRTRKSTTDLTELENVIEYEDRAIDSLHLQFEQKRFLTAIKSLSADQQTVIKLKFIDELENDEIARIIGKSEGAIRVIQHRGIAALRKLLNNEDNANERTGI